MGHTDWKKTSSAIPLLLLFLLFLGCCWCCCLYFCVDNLISSVISCPHSSPKQQKKTWHVVSSLKNPHPTHPGPVGKTCRNGTFRIWSISSSKDCPFNLGQKGEEIYPNHWRIYSTSYITNYIYIDMCVFNDIYIYTYINQLTYKTREECINTIFLAG